MKRWQDRGEVEDSEDDELELSLPSSSPDRPHKRVKQDEDRPSSDKDAADHAATPEDGDYEIAWLPAKVASTYGRKAKLTRPARKAGSIREGNAAATGLEDVRSATDFVINRPVGGVLASTSQGKVSRSPVLGSGSHMDPSTQIVLDDEGNSIPDKQRYSPVWDGKFSGMADQTTPRKATQLEPALTPLLFEGSANSSPVSNDEDLPDARTLFAAPRHKSVSPTPSSPLSEREVSPPAFFEVDRPRLLNRSSQRVQPDDQTEAAMHDEILRNSMLDQQRQGPTFNGRSLRARKEIQLHPYLIDKAKYQRQCKERGIKPVRLVDAEPAEEESQEQQDSSQHSHIEPHSSSLDRRENFVDARPKAYVRLEPPRQEDVMDSDLDMPRSAKRRRINHGRGRSARQDVVETAQRDWQNRADDFSVPPSPPQTTSERSTPGILRRPMYQTASGFQRPRGLSPVPLPTPHFSSEMKRARANDESSTDDESSRQFQDQENAPNAEDASSDTDVESESELLAKRLLRERKRIKGVLPASWLRIDQQAQQQPKLATSLGRGRLTTMSPDRQSPQKGVAKRITSSRRNASEAHNPALNFDYGTESDESVQVLLPGQTQQRLTFDTDRLTVAPSVAVGDDTMENDFVDAMLAGPSRGARPKKAKARQPRIFTQNADPFSEERSQQRSRTQYGLARRTAKHSRRPHRAIVRLSIADAPSPSPSTEAATPPFIRLAMRQAKSLPDQGRHLPTHKHIHLATRDDTHDALAVLRSWRAGTIAPRQARTTVTWQGGHSHIDSKDHDDDRDDIDDTVIDTGRAPLQEISSNVDYLRSVEDLRDKTPARRKVPRPARKPKLRVASSKSTIPQPATTRTRHPLPRMLSARPPQPAVWRAAQLETLQLDFDDRHRSAVFERRIQCLTENVAVRGRRSHQTDAQLAKYLKADPASRIATAEGGETNHADHHHTVGTKAVVHRSRKRLARRLNLEGQHYQQDETPILDSVEQAVEIEPVTDVTKPVLQGLGAYGTLYPIDFGVAPLTQRKYFQEESLIGSGDFYDAIHMASGNLDVPRGQLSVHVGDATIVWTAWNDEVATAFSEISSAVRNMMRFHHEHEGAATSSSIETQNIEYLLRSVARYCSNCLYFKDAVDRQTCIESLERLVTDLIDVVAEHQSSAAVDADIKSHIMRYQVIFSVQAIQLSRHASVPSKLQLDLQTLYERTARALARHDLADKVHVLRSWYQAASTRSDCDEVAAVTTVVILNNTTSFVGPEFSIWQLIMEHLEHNVTDMISVKALDRVWHDVFSLLPLLLIDARGAVKDDDSFTSTTSEGWVIVRMLLIRVFELYQNTSLVRGFAVNVYLRALLHRCRKLIVDWRWARCETMLYTVYDFFSKQSRMLLNKEECRGSPQFLEELQNAPALDVQPDDLSFHIFLKLLATGLLAMRERRVYSDRKIGSSITYRMIPTHGRTYPKEKEMQQSDVDALRNHHDLLCTLYYASPAGHRPGIDILRNLVDHANWHRKACQLNVNAWSMLTAYQASTAEPLAHLLPLVGWFSEIMRSTITQFRLARSEAEHDFHQARGLGSDITEAFLQGTIASNQVQIAATLVSALAGLKRAIQSARSMAVLQAFVHETQFWIVLELFDASQRRLLSTAIEALDVVEATLEAQSRLYRAPESQSASSDSQEFGDFSVLDELDDVYEAVPSRSGTIANELQSPVGSFLSNVFGGDTAPDDALLESAVRVWIRVGGDLVSSGQKTWASYVDDYSPHSWTQMRDTNHKRKFTPYYMSRIVEQPNVDDAVKESVLTSWLIALVEREALLKFQHSLTTALLNHCGSGPLVQNLPFAADPRTGLFKITLEELRQRRLALISSILSNMRWNLMHVRREMPRQAHEVRSHYTEILRKMMQAMKHNYQELQVNANTDTADGAVQGAYVEFVHHVVSFLQQHSAEFCPIDKFFTDSSAFPLPVTDPTYVVGKLKGYALRLSESGPRRELVMFVQSVSERAAVDQQQQYLVTQMATAMCGEFEMGDSSAPTLRHVLLTSILPAYIDTALTSLSGRILSLPLLQACEVALRDLLYDFDLDEESSVHATMTMVDGILRSVSNQCKMALTQYGLCHEPWTLSIMSAMFSVGTATLPTISCIQRQTSHGKPLLQLIRALYRVGAQLEQKLIIDRAFADMDADMVWDEEQPGPWLETKTFAERQVHESANYWYEAEGKCFLRRGSLSKEVQVQVGNADEERDALLHVIAAFRAAYEKTFGSSRAMWDRVAGAGSSGLAELII